VKKVVKRTLLVSAILAAIGFVAGMRPAKAREAEGMRIPRPR
jgi:hypothetical protein